MSYSFPTSASFYENPYGGGEPTRNFGALNTVQQNAARSAFAQYGSVANVTFSEVTGPSSANATIRIGMTDATNSAWAYLPSPSAAGGDIWFNPSSGAYNTPNRGNYAYATFLHEIGHALGLEHPHENGMPAYRDSMEFTVMSYRSYVGAALTGYTNETWGYAQTLMVYDISAIQLMYGPNFGTNSSDSVYSWNPGTGQMSVNGVAGAAPGGSKIFQTVWDGGGTDTYDFSNYSTALHIDLRPGNWSTVSANQVAKLHYTSSQVAAGNIANALLFADDTRSLIENAVGGGGNDRLVGNAVANTLTGGNGNDTLRGEGGNDFLDGSAGFDTAEWQGFLSEYVISRNQAGAIIVSDRIAGRDGVDYVIGVEQFSFGGVVVGVNDLPLSQQQSGSEKGLFFSTVEYFAANPDVKAAGVDPLEHFHAWGWKEGRDPSTDFDTKYYLAKNKDVAAAGMDPLEHWVLFGRAEGRDTAHAVFDAAPINGFDRGYYRAMNPDVVAAGMDELLHFQTYGWKEGRDASGYFDSSSYLDANRDVAAAGMDPLRHYMAFGWEEGRNTGSLLDGNAYLAANLDVAAADVNPLDHWLNYGINEGRDVGYDWFIG